LKSGAPNCFRLSPGETRSFGAMKTTQTDNDKLTTRAEKDRAKLVNADQLLETLFDAECRPTKRTLWNWCRLGYVPVIRIGVSVFFDPSAVRQVLDHGRPRLTHNVKRKMRTRNRK